MSLLFRIIPELELFPTPNERTNNSYLAIREALRPGSFMSASAAVGVIAFFFGLPMLAYSLRSSELLSMVVLYSWPFIVAIVLFRRVTRRYRRILRERLILSGYPCCLNCGYSMVGLDDRARCPECGAGCSNLLAHAGAPIPETSVFPELLAFSRPGEAREALARAYADAGPFYTYRTAMVAAFALVIAVIFSGIEDLLTDKRGDLAVPDTLLPCLGVATFLVGMGLWYRWVRNSVREALKQRLDTRTDVSAPPVTDK